MTKQKWINLTLFFILITIFLTSDWSCESSYPIDKTFPPSELLEDLSAVQQIIEERHPALRYYDFDSRFSRTADSLRNDLTSPMTVKDFFIGLNILIEKVRCGHTKLHLPEFFWKEADSRFKYFPLKLYFFGRKAYCLQNFSTDPLIVPGSEILSVNGIRTADIISNFLRQIPSDGFNQTYKYAKINRRKYGIYPGYSDFPDLYTIEFISPKDTLKRNVKIQARSRLELSKVLSAENKYYKQYDFKILPGSQTALLTIRGFVPDSEEKYLAFLKESFLRLHSFEVQNLVLDLRGNDGGDPYNANALLKYLMLRPYKYFSSRAYGYDDLKDIQNPNNRIFTRKLYILMDGFSFSTSGHVLSILRNSQRGIFIGEESGGSFLCFGCPSDYKLPNTKIVLNYSRCVFAAMVSGFNPGRGIFPDHQVPPDIQDLTAGKDTVLDFALNLISSLCE